AKQVAEFPGARSIAVGDIDNDGFPDLCVLTASGAELWHNRKGKFERDAKPLAEGDFAKAIFIDYDHDYDLDLMLLGAKPRLLRNQGDAGFADRTGDFPFAAGGVSDAVAFRLLPDTKGMDIAVSYRDRASVLYRDRLAGKYEATPFETLPRGATRLVALDVNNDSRFDLAFWQGGLKV